jgi:trimeric autotransporter adhesin
MRLQKLLVLAVAVVSPLAARAQHNISTVAGGGASCPAPATACKLSVSVGGPAAVLQDATGNTYILDNFFSRVFKVDTNGNVTIIAGNGTNGYSGDGGPAASAVLNQPTGMFMDPLGNLYIADSDNGVIRKIDHTTGNIVTVAGTGVLGYNGEGGLATSAQLFFPDGVWVDANQNIFIADKANHIVREVAGVTATNFGIGMTQGNIYTIAGTHPTGAGGTTYHNGFSGDGAVATSAMLNNPWAVYGDSGGNIFIADSTNNAIRVVAGTIPLAGQITGNIYTFAGTPPTAGATGNNVLATSATLNTPHGVYVDGAGNVFISDYENHAIREVANTVAPPAGLTGGNIYTIAGQLGLRGPTGDKGSALAATLDHPSGVFLDGTGDLFIADRDSGEIREVPAVGSPGPPVMVAGDIYLVDGNGHPYFGADGGLATNAELGSPAGVASDASSNIFIADPSNHTIRKAVPGGNIQTVAGVGGSDGYGANGTLATAARLEAPNNVFVDRNNNIFIADTGNHVIREIPAKTGGGKTAGSVYTVAGTPLTAGYAGDGAAATSAQLNTPEDVFVDNSGNIFIADTGNCLIREVLASTGNITTVAGTVPNPSTNPPVCGYNNDGVLATTAKLNQPWAIFVDGFGNLFIADTNNHVVREVPALTSTSMTAGNIYTVAGTPTKSGFSGDSGLATSAKLNAPVGVALDPAGNLFISDASQVIREVTVANGNIQTVAGTAKTAGFSGDGAAATSATLNTPRGIAVTPNRDLLIADSANVRIRSVAGLATNNGLSVSPLNLTFPTEPVGFPSPAQTVYLNNTGNVAVTFTSITASGDFTQTNTCGASLAASAPPCTITITFTPTAPGARAGSITLTDSAAGSPNTINLAGTGVADSPAAVLSAASLTFTTPQLVGTSSTAQSVTLSNPGTGALSITLPITASGDFAETDNCPASLAVNASCAINVTFKPTNTTNPRTGSVTITDNANNTAGSKQTVNLTGTGIAPGFSLSSTSLTFTDQLVGTSSTQQTVTLTNNTTTATALHITSVAVTGANSGDFTQANTCTTLPIAPNATCTISVTFTPTAGSPRSAAVTITDDAPGSPHTISLTGNGTALSLAAASNGSNSQTVKAGKTTTYNMQLSATGGTTAVNVTIACSGAPVLATCSGPSSAVPVTPGTPAPFTITVTTKGLSMLAPGPQSDPRMQPPAAIRTLPLAALALLLSIAAMLAAMQSPAGRLRTVRMAFAAYLVLMPVCTATFLTGCGGGSSSTPPPPPPATAPSITTQPTDQTVAAGQTATFAVVAAGTAPLTYQWQKSGAAISGATSANYTTPATTSADNGATFTAVVTNSAGNATSNAAKLSVPPTTPTGTYTLTVTATANGKAQTTQLTLIVQ